MLFSANSLVRYSVIAFSTFLLNATTGCSHPLEVDLPTGYTGKVTVYCDRLVANVPPIKVDLDGNAPKAACPRSPRQLTAVRNGVVVEPLGKPHWSTTGDGIVVGIDFEVR